MWRSRKIVLLVVILSPAITLTGCQVLGQLLNVAATAIGNGGDFGQMAGQFIQQAAPIAAAAIAENIGERGQGGLRNDRQARVDWRTNADPVMEQRRANDSKEPQLTGQDRL